MKSMMENLESRTLLSAAPAASLFAPMHVEMGAPLLATLYTSPIGRYVGSHTSSQGHGGEGFTVVFQQWNIAAGTMQFKVINPDGSIQKGFGTISGTSRRQFTFQIQTEATRITTITGKVSNTLNSLTGTYITRNLMGVQKDSGTFSLTR